MTAAKKPLVGAYWLRSAGVIVMVGSFIFIARFFISIDASLTHIKNPVRAGILMFLFSIVASFTGVVAAYRWSTILRRLSKRDFPLKWAMKVYLKSSIAKYLPGNIFHFIGRNLLTAEIGISQPAIAFASFLELLLTLFAGAALGLASAPFLIEEVILLFRQMHFDSVIMSLSAGFSLIVLALIFLFFRKQTLALLRRIQAEVAGLGSSLLTSLTIYAAQLVLLGLLYAGICTWILGVSLQAGDAIHLCAVYILSWVVGFIVPGVPGGIGVREAVLLLALSPRIGQEAIVLSALLQRCMTVAGDLILFVLSLTIPVISAGVCRGKEEGE